MLAVFERLGGRDAADIAKAFWTGDSRSAFVDYLTTCMPLYNRHRPADADLVTARSMEHANFELFQHWLNGEQRTFDLHAALDRIVAPVLLLAGEDDPVTPLPGAQRIADALGPERCTFEVFPDCGHGVWRDQPAHAFATIRRFITT
jgi:proline iminopeptidase